MGREWLVADFVWCSAWECGPSSVHIDWPWKGVAVGEPTFNGHGVLVEDVGDELLEGCVHEGRLARRALVDDTPQGPQVGSRGVCGPL